LIAAAKFNRQGHRDATMILIAFRHGLRAAELVDLRWDQIDLGRNACLHVRRVKNGMPSVHPLQGDEMRALQALKRESSSFAYSCRSVVRHSPERASPRWSRGLAWRQGLSSVCIRTCCAMRVATHWRTGATTRVHCKPT
jgi:type 1 fimbriae regulatory protein FimB/type 1 fimbriae regulatory protein FimE